MKKLIINKEKLSSIVQHFFQNETRRFYSSGVKLAYENYRRANSPLWVNSLCYFTLISIVPVSAILFSFGNWLGMGNRLIDKLENNSPLNDEAISYLMEFTENLLNNARGGVLAGLGFIFLGSTLLSMFSIIERALNDIWQVKKSRIFLRKITDYLAFLIFTPIFILVINDGAITFITKNIAGSLSIYLTKTIPYMAILVFLTAVYMLMPNTKVKFFPAFCSAIFTAVLSSACQNIIFYLQNRINTYNRIYGSFAIIFIFLLWLRMLWFLIILGGHLSYFLQNRHLYTPIQLQNINFKTNEYCALALVVEFMKRYKDNKSPISKQELSNITHIPIYLIRHSVNILKNVEIIAEVFNPEGEEDRYFIIKNIEDLTFGELLEKLETYGERVGNNYEKLENHDKYMKIIEEKSLNTKISDLI